MPNSVELAKGLIVSAHPTAETGADGTRRALQVIEISNVLAEPITAYPRNTPKSDQLCALLKTQETLWYREAGGARRSERDQETDAAKEPTRSHRS